MNRGVTDPTETSILQLITFVVSEVAVQNGGKKKETAWNYTRETVDTCWYTQGGKQDHETQEASGGA